MSVILPTFNRTALLPRSIGSVLAQSFEDLELLVVDDGSAEDVAGAVERIAGTDRRVRVVRNPTRGGGAVARNLGLRTARGNLVAFQDSDDAWLPGRLQRTLDALAAAGPDTGIAYGSFWWHLPAGAKLRPRRRGRLDGDLTHTLLVRNPVTTATVLVRRDLLARVGGFDVAMPRFQDWELWLRLARITRFAFVRDALVDQFPQPDSISSDPEARLRALHLLLEKNRDLYEADPAAEARIRQRLAAHLRQLGRADEARAVVRAGPRRPWARWDWM